MLQLAIGNVDSRLKERTEQDIKDLESLYDYFLEVINKSKVSTKEEIDHIKDEMQTTLFKKMDDIYEYRKGHRLPPLLEDDFEKSKIKGYFKKWLTKHREELPY